MTDDMYMMIPRFDQSVPEDLLDAIKRSYKSRGQGCWYTQPEREVCWLIGHHLEWSGKPFLWDDSISLARIIALCVSEEWDEARRIARQWLQHS